jgi:hypothetical protein
VGVPTKRECGRALALYCIALEKIVESSLENVSPSTI